MQGLKPIRIVILGAGFAGITAAQELSRLARADASLDIHLVNQENYFLFQPLLPEIVSGSIEPNHIVNPIRLMCPHVWFHCATVQDIRLADRYVVLRGTAAQRTRRLRYDHLILSMGAHMDVTRVPGMAEHSLPLRTLGDAYHLRSHVIRCFEEADLEDSESHQRRSLTVIAVGGGFSGVETIGALHSLMRSAARWYPRARAVGYRSILIHSRERLLHDLAPELGHAAYRALEKQGIDVRLNTAVKEATPDGILLSTGEMLRGGTVVCTVGNCPHPLIRKLNLPREDGRLLVSEDLRVQGSDHVWAIGDNAVVPDVRSGGSCPPTAQYATRQGTQCARNIWAVLHGESPSVFSYRGLGQLASVGHRTGVARVMGLNVSGVAAWLLWRSVYLAKVPGRRRKMQIGLDWLFEWLFPRDITMMDIRRTSQLKRAHYRPGDVVVRQGEVGDHFYLIQSGMVEIVRQEEGKPDQQLAVRSAGDSFGEVALLKGVPRTATVRCLTPVNVVMLTEHDFESLVGSSHQFRSQIDETLATLTEDLSPVPLHEFPDT